MNHSEFPTILITGATGKIGTELTKQLAAKGIPFRALVRKVKNAGELSFLKEAEIIEGDFNNTESITRALKGVNKAFLLTNSSEQAEALQSSFVEIAKHQGVKHIVKLSQLAADINSPVRFLRYHAILDKITSLSDEEFNYVRSFFTLKLLEKI